MNNPLGLATIAIPKCGSTAIKSWWLGLTAGRAAPLGREVHALVRQSSIDRAAFVRLQRTPERCFAFSVVRDPLSRLASAFRSKFIGLGVLSRTCWPMVEQVQLGLSSGEALPPKDSRRTLAREGSVATFARVNYELGISFRQFVHAVCEAPDEALNPHWRPQSWFVRDVTLDLLGRLDDPQTVLDFVARRIGRVPVPVAAPVRSQAPVRDPRLGDAKGYPDVEAGRFRWNGVIPSESDLYDESLRALVRRRCSADVELFERACREAADWEA